MRIAVSESIRRLYPKLCPIPAEPGFVDLTIILSRDWKPEYHFRARQLRYIVVNTVDQAIEFLSEMEYVTNPQDPS